MNFTYGPDRIALIGPDNEMLAEVTFPAVDADTVNINHTFVADSLRGQGVAGRLMEAVVRHLTGQSKMAVLTCPYAVRWFENHSEYQHLVRNFR